MKIFTRVSILKMGETKCIMCSSKARKRVSAMRSANHHPAVMIKHRAKHVERLTSEKRNQAMESRIDCSESQFRNKIDEEEKEAYINFIYRLMARMTVESLRHLMDAAINEI